MAILHARMAAFALVIVFVASNGISAEGWNMANADSKQYYEFCHLTPCRNLNRNNQFNRTPLGRLSGSDSRLS